MTTISDLWFPGASLRYRAPVDGGSILGGKPKCLWHDTETSGLPSYSSGYWPNMTICKGVAYQHIPANRAARALRNESGGIQTNRWNVFQIECCGFANHVEYHPVMSEVAEWLHDARGCPLIEHVDWRSYPSSYGQTPIRLSYDEWADYTGHLGHQHAPENVHGDPGWPFPIAQILEADEMTIDELDKYLGSEKGQNKLERAVVTVLRQATDPDPKGDRPASVWFDTVARQVKAIATWVTQQ